MKVIVITRSMHSKEPVTITLRNRENVSISVTDMIYTEYKSVMGVFKTAEAARQFIEKNKEELIDQYGEIALDDEYIRDGHTYYTYGSCTKDLEDVKGGAAE